MVEKYYYYRATSESSSTITRVHDMGVLQVALACCGLAHQILAVM